MRQVGQEGQAAALSKAGARRGGERGGVWGVLDGWRPAETPTSSFLSTSLSSATEVWRSNEKILNVKWKPIKKKTLHFERNSNKRLSHKLACVLAEFMI